MAEFNIIVDPEAAHIVFNAPWKLTMVGLDLTHQALCTPEVQRRIEEIGTPLAVIVSGLMDFFRKTYQDNQDFVDPPCMIRAPWRILSILLWCKPDGVLLTWSFTENLRSV